MNRGVCAGLGIFVVVLLGGTAWGSALSPTMPTRVSSQITAGPVHGAPLRFTMHGPAAGLYTTVERPLRGPAARSLARAFPRIVLSRALSRAAAAYARVMPSNAKRQPPIAFLEFLIHWAGCPDPSAAATVFYTTADGPGEAVRAIRRLLAQRDMKDVTHIGVARVPGDGRPYRWRWGILAVHRSIQLPGFPSHGPAGGSVPLQFRLLGKLDRPDVWVLPPGGRVRRLPVGRSGRGRAFGVAAIPLGPRWGALWVEIVGHGPLGPKVAANFPVFVGETPPRAWTGFAPPDESWVRTAAQAETLMTLLVNADRGRFGLAPLKPDAALARIARAHSGDMAAHGYFGHTSPLAGGLVRRLQAAGYTATWCGENIAEADSIAGAEADLMRSPGHRANILAVEPTHLGIGIVERQPGHGVRWLITQEFSRPVGTLPRAGFRLAVRRLIAARRGARGLAVISPSDALDGIAGEMAARVATGRVSEAGCAPSVATRLRQAGITFRRFEVVTYRVPGPDGMKLPGFLFDRGVNGIGIGVNRPAPSPLTIVVLIVTLNTR